MQVLDTVLALLALLSLSAFFAARCSVPGGAAPLLAMACAMLVLSAAGIAGVLVPATWLFYALCFAALLFAAATMGLKKIAAALATPGFLLFLAGALLALVVLAVRQPLLHDWDEFVFWGVAPKIVKLTGQLYTVADAGWFWTATQSPGFVMLGYFAQAFGAGFAAWKVYFACDLLLFACFAALLAPYRLQEWRLFIPLGAIALVLPFFFSVYGRTIHATWAYATSYADLPAGFLFGACMAAYFALRKQRAPLWPVPVLLAAMALTKANLLPLALVAAAVVAADRLFFAKTDAAAQEAGAAVAGGRHRKSTRGLAAWGFAACAFLAPLAASRIWGMHAAWANAQNPATRGAETGGSSTAALVEGLRQWFGLAPRSENFSTMLRLQTDAFLGQNGLSMSMLGSGLVTCLAILAVFALALWLAQGKTAKLRVGLAAALSTLGFLGYQFVLFVSYAFLFKAETGFSDYERYTGSYLAGWLLLALGLVCLGALQSAWRYTAASAGLLAGAVAAVVLFGVQVLPGYSILDYPDTLLADRRAEAQTAAAATAHIPAGSRTFFVSQGDDGGAWFIYAYHFFPLVLDYSAGGGSFGPPLAAGEEAPAYYNPLTLPELEAYLAENHCEYLFMEQSDDVFVQTYAPLFADGLAGAEGGPALYRRGADGVYRLVEAMDVGAAREGAV